MKLQVMLKKTAYCLLIFPIFVCACTINTNALTQGQSAAANLGVDITWYDFGSQYNSYSIYNEDGDGLYTLSMSRKNSETTFKAKVNGKGELVSAPLEDTNDYIIGSMDESGSTNISKTESEFIVNRNGSITMISTAAFSDIIGLYRGYATAVKNPGGTKCIIDLKGNIVFEDLQGKYDSFNHLSGDVFIASYPNGECVLINTQGTVLTSNTYNYIDTPYQSGLILVIKDGKSGFIDLDGKEVIAPFYDNASSLTDEIIPICTNNKWGLIDKTGKELVAPKYDNLYALGNGLIAVNIGEKNGIIDQSGKIIQPIEYGSIYDNGKGVYLMPKDGESFVLDSSGNIVGTKPYSYMQYYLESDNHLYVIKEVNGTTLSAYLDKDENMLTGFKEFTLVYLNDDLYLGIKSGDYPPGVTPPHDYQRKAALLDAQGNNLTGFKYQGTKDNVTNNFVIFTKYYYDNMGLINQYGAEVLPTMFNEISVTADGYVFVTVADPDTQENQRVGYFKIPDGFATKKGVKPITVYLNDVELYFDVEPAIVEQRTMVPMRKILESLGGTVEWDAAGKTVTSKCGEQQIALTIGSDVAKVNGKEVKLDVAPFIESDRTLVPLRFVSENLGADVRWDNSLRRVIITVDGGTE